MASINKKTNKDFKMESGYDLDLYFNILKQAPLCIKLWDANGKFIAIGDYLKKEHFLKTDKDIANWDYFSCVAKKYVPRIKKALEDAKKGKVTHLVIEHVPGTTTHLKCAAIVFSIKIKSKVEYVALISHDMSAQPKVEKELKAEKDTIDNFIDNNPFSIIIYDAAGYFLRGNAAAKKLFKSLPDHSYDFFNDPHIKKNKLEKIFAKIKKGETATLPPIWYNPRDVSPKLPDNPIFIETVTFSIKDNNGKIKEYVNIHRDLTRQNQLQGHLLEAQKMAHLGSWTWEVATDTIKWSEELYRIVGLDSKNPPPTYADHPKLYTKESWQKLNEAVKLAVSKGLPYEIELDMVRPNGEIRNTLTKGSARKDNSGRVKGLFGTVLDITERVKAGERYKTLYKSSRDAIMILEPPNWNFTAGNPTTIKMFNAKDEKEFISKTPGDLSPKYQPDKQLSSVKAKKMIELAMKKGSSFFEWTHKTIAGKEFLATVLLTKMNIKGMDVLQATVRNISKEKNIENELKDKIMELEKMNRLMIGRELKMVELKKKFKK